MTRWTLTGIGAALVLFLGLGCSDARGRGEELGPDPSLASVVDSLLPIEEELRRFREGTAPLDAFQVGWESPETLVAALIQRLQSADTLGVAELAINRAEFAYLYYPNTIYTSPPYELSPALVWFQLQNRSSRGLARLLQRYAGETLFAVGHECPDAGETFGEAWIWHGCRVIADLPSGERVEEQIFGSILRFGDRYKLVGFSNEY
jgi:hypothetical protein